MNTPTKQTAKGSTTGRTVVIRAGGGAAGGSGYPGGDDDPPDPDKGKTPNTPMDNRSKAAGKKKQDKLTPEDKHEAELEEVKHEEENDPTEPEVIDLTQQDDPFYTASNIWVRCKTVQDNYIPNLRNVWSLIEPLATSFSTLFYESGKD